MRRALYRKKKGTRKDAEHTHLSNNSHNPVHAYTPASVATYRIYTF